MARTIPIILGAVVAAGYAGCGGEPPSKVSARLAAAGPARAESRSAGQVEKARLEEPPVATAADSEISRDQFWRNWLALRRGMSRDEVAGCLGQPQRVRKRGTRWVSFEYDPNRFDGDSQPCHVTFRNGHVFNWQVRALYPPADVLPPLPPRDRWEALSSGMSSEDVAARLGEPLLVDHYLVVRLGAYGDGAGDGETAGAESRTRFRYAFSEASCTLDFDSDGRLAEWRSP